MNNQIMIDKKLVKTILEEVLEENNFFLVDVKVSKNNEIDITFDSLDRSIDLDDCVKISRAVESGLDRDKEDFSLTVGSAGLTAPFKVPMQYKKNIGKEVDVFFRTGKKLSGILKSFEGDTIELCDTTQKMCESFKLNDINRTILKI